MNLMRSAIKLAVQEAARVLLRPDIAELIARDANDYDFLDAPRTKAWVESHGQPVFSPHADFINGLVELACKLERELGGK